MPEKRSRKAPRLHFPPEPAYVVLKSQSDSVSLRDLVLSRCKSLSTKYRPTWWLPNGHMHTMHSVLGDFSEVDKVWYQRRLLRLVDGGTLGLDFAPPDSPDIPDDTPIIVVQHGLTGGSHEPYVRSVLAPATAPVDRGGLGYRAVVVNFRGCSGVPITSPKFYTAAQTDDLRQALTYISSRFPNAPLVGLGFSIGGNVLIRYLAEEGVNSRISAAAILGNPWDLVKNTLGLHDSTMGRYVYLPGMGANIKRLLLHHQAIFFKNPAHPTAAALRAALHLKKPTLTDFDDIYTRTVGDTPPFPFNSVHEYYAWASSHEVAADVRVPCLTINAADDPVVQRVQMPGADAQNNGYVVTAITESGGHLGWFFGRKGRKRWTTKPVLEWLQLFGTDVVRDVPTVVVSVDDDGFIRESQWPNLGCKEVGDMLVDGNRPRKELFLQGF
ncbi:AB hydrolase-1 domain-containing protein [Mycena indigotica]|uniref:AB hydrolase-1 domain-containing protein n=1 Tax=Mycena indigotica TaxID=2126181 RepID=A0A8H6WHE3_9AGAR|nr:AB hydrolase-1 domain-containing protein [Mycena indigotica]KAF7312384.1 AB hydrolase-1 domain-containing protein [Mycena indigotica]